MCLGIPGKVVEKYSEHGALMGKVDFGGVRKRVCLALTPEVRLDDYVIVHVGFALEIIDPAEAATIFTFLERMDELGELRVQEESDRQGAPAGAADQSSTQVADP